MKFTEFTEKNKDKLTEQPAPAYTNPAEFQSRYGMSLAQAEVAIDNVVKLNPGYNSPAVKDSIRNYLLNNPQALQSANDNIKPTTPKSNFKINPGSLVKGALAKTAGVIGMIFDPSLFGEIQGDGTITPEIQLQWDIEKHLRETDPAAYVEMIDTQWNSLSDKQRQDPNTIANNPKDTQAYKDAVIAAGAANTNAVRPEVPSAGMPASRPVRKPDTPPSRTPPQRTPADPRRTRPEPSRPTPKPGVEPDTKPPAPAPKPAAPGVEPDTKPPAPTPNTNPNTNPNPAPNTNPNPAPNPAPNTNPKYKITY